MEYDILEANSIDDLKGLVTAAIADDWVPLGGVAIDDRPQAQPPYNVTRYVQAMTKPAAAAT